MNPILDKAVTIRFNKEDHTLLIQQAEQQGCSIADMVRKSWRHYQQQQQLEQHLMKQERRQYKATFAMLSLALELKPNERQQMMTKLREIGVTW
jgi:Lon protease-like protein